MTEHEWSRERWSWRAGRYVERQLPEPIRIPWRGGTCSLRTFAWGPSFTNAELRRHRSARKEAEKRGVRKLRHPWLAIYRMTHARWAQWFGEEGQRPQADCEELFQTICLEIAETFGERAEQEPWRALAYAKKAIRGKLVDAVYERPKKHVEEPTGPEQFTHLNKWVRRVRRYSKNGVLPGINALTNEPGGIVERLVDDEEPEQPGLGDEDGCRWEGLAPVADRLPACAERIFTPLWSPDEDQIIAAIDLRRAGLPAPNEDEEKIDMTDKILSKLFGPEWTSLVRGDSPASSRRG